MAGRESKRNAVLEKGLALASEVGLEGLTLERLAASVDVTRGGLYAHFDSKEEILREVLRTAVDRFVEEGVRPALAAPRGEPRVRALFDAWLEWTKAPPLPGGCVFISSATELDDRPGPLRDYLVETQRAWRRMLRRVVALAVKEGDFSDELDPEQFVYELYAVILVFHYFDRLFQDDEAEARARRAFDGLVERARNGEQEV